MDAGELDLLLTYRAVVSKLLCTPVSKTKKKKVIFEHIVAVYIYFFTSYVHITEVLIFSSRTQWIVLCTPWGTSPSDTLKTTVVEP